MKKLIILFLCLFAYGQAQAGVNIVNIAWVWDTGGESVSTLINEDWNRSSSTNLGSDWIESFPNTGDLEIVNDTELQFTTNATGDIGTALWNGTGAPSSTDQWGYIEITGWGSNPGTDNSADLVFRSEGTTGGSYAVSLASNGTVWLSERDSDDWVRDIGSVSSVYTTETAVNIGVTTSGTGDNFTVKVWVNPTNSYPYDVTNWDSASDTAEATINDPITTELDEPGNFGVGVSEFTNAIGTIITSTLVKFGDWEEIPSVHFADDFSTDPSSRWGALEGTMTWDSGNEDIDTPAEDYFIYNTDTGSTDHYVKVNLVSGEFPGPLVGCTTNGADYCYSITDQNDNKAWLTVVEPGNGDGWLEDIDSDDSGVGFTTGDDVCVTRTGTGQSASINIWIDCVNEWPISFSKWDHSLDVPTYTLSSLGTSYEADGTYVGLGHWNSQTYDDFSGGAIPTIVTIIDDFTYYGTSSAHLGGTEFAPWTTLETEGSATSIDTTNDELDYPINENVLIYEYQELDFINQWVCTYNTVSNNFMGPYLRSENDVTTYAYTIRKDVGGMQPRYCGGSVHSNKATDCTDIGSDAGNGPHNGDYSCVAVSGTGTDTLFEYWDFGTSEPSFPRPGTDPSVTWGAPDASWTDDPGQAANVGKNVGLYQGSTGGGSIGKFWAGSWDE